MDACSYSMYHDDDDDDDDDDDEDEDEGRDGRAITLRRSWTHVSVSRPPPPSIMAASALLLPAPSLAPLDTVMMSPQSDTLTPSPSPPAFFLLPLGIGLSGHQSLPP